MSSPPPKREKLTGPIDVLNPEIDIQALKASFHSGQPYPHVVIPNLCLPQAALAMHEEIKSLQGTLKETDLFRVYQTGDFANAEEGDERLKYLLALRRELNSQHFRSMIEQICGVEGQLSEEIDLAANVYSQGCHLLCHDDVIGSRLISYIVYLSDPEDEPWNVEDGGRLELYASDSHGLPLAEPQCSLPPTFNSMAMFVVKPGVSFHSVQEVFADNKPRVSLQGWFHQRTAVDAPNATLQQILCPATALPESEFTHPVLVQEESLSPLSPLEVEELKEWVNPLYLNPDSIVQIQQKCALEENCVSLVGFLSTSWMNRVKQEIALCESKHDAHNVWNTVGPSHLRRFQVLSEGDVFQQLRDKIESQAFVRFLHLAMGDLTLVKRSPILFRRFRKGSDYTVAHAHADSSVVDVTLCMVQGDLDTWQSGDCGGFEVYLNKEEEEGKGDVAVYAKDEESDGVVSIDPGFATLSLVFRDEHRMHFVKYVSKSAPSDRYDVTCSFQVQEEEE